ncbi:hypothetical protein [Rhodoferax sp. U11-2br]|uniref:hypothetical protein n=1 Tax=Rhodoferax sp. U11-2br TaxID=2838878 RepID=UPI001BE99B0A|nr:hypothetical protein [Rhodoferax sp. U11-2br]MBT3067158.1 hypothetical protein [Rhodoferax sp. U11-2br]
MRQLKMFKFEFACFVTLTCLMLPAHAFKGGIESLSGTWLVEAENHDWAIERGLITAEYPVLVVDADGKFRAYRFGVDCEEDPIARGNLDERAKRIHCENSTTANKSDQMGGHAVLVTEGDLHQVTPGSWQFLPSPKGRALLDDAANSKPLRAGSLFRGSPTQLAIFMQMMADPVEIVRDGRHLHFSLAGGKWRAVFKQYPRDVLVDAGVANYIIGLPYGQYFRCTLRVFDDDNLNSALIAELLKLRRLVRSINDMAQDQIFAWGEASKGNKDALSQWEAKNRKNYDMEYAELSQTPAMNAAANRNIGAYLGCPKRDGM